MTIRSVCTVMLLTAAVWQPVSAGQTGSAMAPLIELGGSMHAAAEACGDYSSAKLAEMKAEQRSQAVSAGLDGAKFDTLFQQGYDKARTKLAGASQAQKDEACKSLRAMGR